MKLALPMLDSVAAEPGKTPDEGGKRGVFPTAKRRNPATISIQQHTQTQTQTQGLPPTVRRPVIDSSMTMNHRPTIARTDPSTLWRRAKRLRKEGSTNGRSPVRPEHDTKGTELFY